MKIIHSADWHLGVRLYNQNREIEQQKFLHWMLILLEKEQPDVLIIAGDIFDSSTPSNAAQELYYQFLVKATRFCGDIVIIAGNHDSTSFLDAPKGILQSLNVHVVGAMRENIEDEIIEIYQNGETAALIAAVPYLRERDIRRGIAGESVEDKQRALTNGIVKHYHDVAALAEAKRAGRAIPIIGTGHLFAVGGKTLEHDGVRELNVGNLGSVGKEAFPDSFDYVALGHLHVPQKVAGCEHIRYSGTPIAMGFSECGQQKQVLKIEFSGKVPNITPILIPTWQQLAVIKGEKETVYEQIKSLVVKQEEIWLEVHVDAEYNFDTRLVETLQNMMEGSAVKILRINYPRKNIRTRYAEAQHNLQQLSPEKVFQIRLDKAAMPEEEEKTLRGAFAEILRAVEEKS